MSLHQTAAETSTQKVVIVNGSPDMLGTVLNTLDAGRYDVVFVESSDRAYSQVKKLRPDMVILCIRIEDLGGFQCLTMLTLDAETRHIPVLTYTTEYEGQDVETATARVSDDERPAVCAQHALPMN